MTKEYRMTSEEREVRNQKSEFRSPSPWPSPLSTGARGVALWLVVTRSEEHTSELQSPCNLVCRLLLEKKTRHARRQGRSQRAGTPRDRLHLAGHHHEPDRQRDLAHAPTDQPYVLPTASHAREQHRLAL